MEEGQKIWVEGEGGEAKAAVYVGESEEAFGGGPPRAYVVYADTGKGEIVDVMRIVPRDDDDSEQA